MQSTGNYKLRRKIDPVIPTIGFGLAALGLVMVLSASQITAADKYDDAYHFFTRQLLAFGIGLFGFFYFLKLPLERLYQKRSIFLWATLVLLILVFLPGIGGQTAGVYRWVGIGNFSFQPSEVAKLLLVIYFSAWFAAKGDDVASAERGFIPFLLILAVIALLVAALGRDLDTAVVLIVSAVAIFFAAKAKIWQVLIIGLLAIGAVMLLIFATPYRLNRFQSFQNLKQNNTNFDAQNRGYHTQQALNAIGSGGLWGVGFGQGISKYFYLPEAHTDSIFAVIAEELGFVRAAILVLAYLVLFARALAVAQKANSRFVSYLAVGISTLIIIQALINIGGMLAILPLAGIPLPFVSYGGTSLIVSLAMLGVLTNASRETKS